MGFRCGNKKCLALVRGIMLRRVGIPDGSGEPECRLRGKYRYCGQKYGLSGVAKDDKRRISALQAEAADLERLCGLTERGFELVNGKK